MIEISNSRNGKPILLKDGRLLASSIDPVREAQQWLNKAQAEMRSDGSPRSVILFGLGSGYQATMLCEILGAHAVLVIEPDLELVQAARSIHPELQQASIVSAANWMELIESALFRDAVCTRYVVLKNPISVQTNSDYFAAVNIFLTGRERLAFLLQLKMRPELYGILDADKIETVMSAVDASSGLALTELVSVKTLQKLFSAQSRITRERRMWKLLEELVV